MKKAYIIAHKLVKAWGGGAKGLSGYVFFDGSLKNRMKLYALQTLVLVCLFPLFPLFSGLCIFFILYALKINLFEILYTVIYMYG